MGQLALGEAVGQIAVGRLSDCSLKRGGNVNFTIRSARTFLTLGKGLESICIKWKAQQQEPERQRAALFVVRPLHDPLRFDDLFGRTLTARELLWPTRATAELVLLPLPSLVNFLLGSLLYSRQQVNERRPLSDWTIYRRLLFACSPLFD